MSADRSYIRVKAMIIARNADGTRHLVSGNLPTVENPAGFHRLIGGSVELGETFQEAIVREVDEELGARIVGLTRLGILENIFEYDGEPGHEIVTVFEGRLDPQPPVDGGTLTESDGSVVPVMWRPVDDAHVTMPLYPAGVDRWVRDSLAPADLDTM